MTDEPADPSADGTDRATCDRCGEPIQGKMYVLDAIEHPRTGAVGDCCWKPGDEVVLL